MIEKIVNIIDKLYYHKIIFDYLKKIELKTCFDVGSHKGEFLSNLINIKEVKEIHCFEPQRSIFKNLRINSFNKKVKCLADKSSTYFEFSNLYKREVLTSPFGKFLLKKFRRR